MLLLTPAATHNRIPRPRALRTPVLQARAFYSFQLFKQVGVGTLAALQAWCWAALQQHRERCASGFTCTPCGGRSAPNTCVQPVHARSAVAFAACAKHKPLSRLIKHANRSSANLPPPCVQNVHTEMVSTVVEALFGGDEEAVRTIFATSE